MNAFSGFLKALLLTACMQLCSGCSADADLKWTEDVVLPDGRVITLNRIQHFDKDDYVDAHSFEFVHPVTQQTVKWQSDAALYVPELPQPAARQKRPTRGFFSLVALFMVQDVPHVLVTPTFGGYHEHAGCPNPPMFIFRNMGSGWQQIPYALSPLREIRGNTTSDPKSYRDYIKTKNFKLAAGEVRILNDPVAWMYHGINLGKSPSQVFQCPEQKRFDFK